MDKVVIGVFSQRSRAENAISQLEYRGYDPKDISIMMKDTLEAGDIARQTGAETVVGNTLGGAATGAVLGGLAGLAASFVIPGLGAFFIGGPLAAALGLTGAAATAASGAATGAVAGGILGALTSVFGLSTEEARIYEDRINEGGILLAVPARIGEEQEVEGILTELGADNIRIITSPERHTTRGEEISEGHHPAYFSEIRKRRKSKRA